MKKTLVNISTHDPMINVVRSVEYCNEMFGEDYIEDYGVEIPEALAIEAQAVYQRLMEISRELEKYKGKL
jgi:predicted DNA-binding protein YlxM (UPF0122 family)